MAATQLGERDLRGALELLARVGEAPDVDSFRSEALTGLRALVGCDRGMLGDGDPAIGAARSPLDLRPGTIPSGSISLWQWSFDQDASGGRDYSARDRELLTLLRPHLSAAQRNAELRERMGANGNDNPELRERASGNGNGDSELREWAGGNGNGDSELRERASGNGNGDAPAPGQPGAPASVPTLDPARLRAAGLSPREIEVLDLVSQGLITDAISLQLGISSRTVQKHLERIHSKLGVGTRIAAVAAAHALSRPAD